ncbi:MAG: hypothetical protein QG599_644 [Pseudomonadota bacterium]|nr:hypothetical protein [Pseudomonadota bacterium]
MLNQICRRVLLLVSGGLLLSGASLAQAGQWLVIDAEGTTLTPGTLLTEQQKVALSEGARLTLLAENGETLKLDGPYSGVPGQKSAAGSDGKNLAAIASLLQGHSKPTTTLGVLRSGSRRTAPPGAVDVDRPGKQCLSRDPVVLWRGNATTQESMTLMDASGKMLANLPWPMGEAELTVPADYFQDGQSYQIQHGSRQASWQVRKASQSMDNLVATAAWMADSGCQAQALAVLQELKD